MTEPVTPIPPLVVEFDVATQPAHAFDTWVNRTTTWWPASHSRSGRPERIVFESFVGGRVYERDADGTEHDWARVVAWDPPHALRLRWHHVFPSAEATDLEVTFHANGERTKVRIVQSGWEALGADEGTARRDRTTSGWARVTTTYRDLLQEGA